MFDNPWPVRDMTGRRRRVPTAALALALLASGAWWSGCSGDSESEGDAPVGEAARFAPPTAPPDDARSGGRLRVLSSGDVDSLDPGSTNYQFGYMIGFATQRSLFAWQPDDQTQPTPDLAAAKPEVSEDGLTVTIALRPGVRFSPPVDRVVRCADFKYAIERGLLPGVANAYVPTYMRDLVGFEAAQREVRESPDVAPNLRGVECAEAQTLVFHLNRTASTGLIGALSLQIGAPVPREYAAPFDADNPSTYGAHVVATGPYMVANDGDGELTGYTPGKEIELVRNPNWDAATDWRPAYLDSITVQEGFSDSGSVTRKILAGETEVSGGDFPLDPSSLELAANDYPEQLAMVPLGGTRYMPFDTTRPPFDDVNVRRAVIAGINRVELRDTLGGSIAGPVATHFIPPGIPGFEEAGGYSGPDLDFDRVQSGDPELAASYMRKAGFESGRCERACDITVVADASPSGSATAEVLRDELERLGFDVTLNKVSIDVLYTKFCTVPQNQPNICAGLGWLKEFADPQGILQASFSGNAITSSGNTNWSQLDDPTINRAIDRAIYVDEPEARARAWARIDRLVTAQAPAIPWNWIYQAEIASADVAGVINLFTGSWDLSFTSLRSPSGG